MTFQHTFKDGRQCTLAFDMSQCPIRCAGTPVPPGCESEYAIWRDTVVAPAIYGAMNAGQTVAMVKKGIKTLRKGKRQ
jgi:hypothetical protein